MLVFIPTVENGEELCIRGFFLFSTHNQLPQIIIGQGSVINHIKALLVVIRTTFKNLLKIFSVFPLKFQKFVFFSFF